MDRARHTAGNLSVSTCSSSTSAQALRTQSASIQAIAVGSQWVVPSTGKLTMSPCSTSTSMAHAQHTTGNLNMPTCQWIVPSTQRAILVCLTRLNEPHFYHTPCVAMSGPCDNRTDSAVRARFSTTRLVWSCTSSVLALGSPHNSSVSALGSPRRSKMLSDFMDAHQFRSARQFRFPSFLSSFLIYLRTRQARPSRHRALSAHQFKPLQSGRNGSCPALSGQR